MPDDPCFDWVHPCNLVFEICRPRDLEVVTVRHA